MNDHNYCLHCGMKRQRPEGCGECGPQAPGIEVERHPHYLPPGTRLNYGQYLVGRVLGAGGFGVTYLGVDMQLGRKLAIKELLPVSVAGRSPDGIQVASLTQGEEALKAGLDDFLREAKALVPFNDHPNIVSILDFFEENNTAYLVMPYLEGKTLTQLLEEQGDRLDVEEAVTIAVAVLDALRATHQERLLHRDVKPGNVFLTEDGAIKLLDFGSARFVVGERTKTMTAVVTDGYAPYEQYQTKTKQGPPTDIYAVGAMLYRMLTGQVPQAALMRLSKDSLVPPEQLCDGISRRESNAILTAMAIKPEERFQSALAFINALTGNTPSVSPVEPPQKSAPSAWPVTKEPTRTKPESAEEKPRALKSQRGLWIGAAVGGALGLIALFAAVLTRVDTGRLFGESNAPSSNSPLGSMPALPKVGNLSSGQPFLYDVDKNGVDDFVGRYREFDYKTGEYLAYVTALSGANLKPLWLSDPIGKWPGETGMLSLRRVNDTLILASSESATLTAYSIADGKRMWATRLPDKLKQLEQTNSSIRAESIDGKFSLVNLQTGAGTIDNSSTPLAALARSDEGINLRPCRRLLKANVWRDLTAQGVYCPLSQRKWDPATPSAKRHINRPKDCSGDTWLTYATLSQGSKTPYLVAYDRPSKKIKWKAQLTPLGSKRELNGFPLLHVVDDRILAIYGHEVSTWVHLIDRSTGSQIWKTSLPSRYLDVSTGGMLADSKVFLNTGTDIYLFNARDGNQLAHLKERN